VTLADGPGPGVRAVRVTYLEMTEPGRLRPSPQPEGDVLLVRAERPTPELSWFFYRAVGAEWHWVDRLSWTQDQWLAWVSDPGHELWTCWIDGAPAGYAELMRDGTECELAYFGLIPGFEGVGLGGWLLTRALERAWDAEGTTRVWVHTCDLDGPAALPNYLARGMVEYRHEVEHRRVEDAAPPPPEWPQWLSSPG
jgi:GNAT superfamily N-acetyltransferase